MEEKYLHGFIPEEQQRLIDQASFLTHLIYPKVDLKGCKSILEIGCGVGAQTAKLLELFPDAQITCIDHSELQLSKAKENLKFARDRVSFLKQDAMNLNLPGKYDGVYICWVLEHIPDPSKVFESLKSYLLPKAKIWITEVFNSSFYFRPYGECLAEYYRKYNDFQRSLGGNPDVGADLGNLLSNAGFMEIELHPGGFHLDKRDRKYLIEFVEFWTELMRSGAETMLEAGLITLEEIKGMEADLKEISQAEDPIFFYRFVQAQGRLL